MGGGASYGPIYTLSEVREVASKAYILIETAVGQTRGVASALEAISAVDNVDSVTGPYDVIAVVSAEDLNAVGSLVTDRIHSIKGIIRTVTCLSIGAT